MAKASSLRASAKKYKREAPLCSGAKRALKRHLLYCPSSHPAVRFDFVIVVRVQFHDSLQNFLSGIASAV
ncbi:hypothetical protein WN944_005013 [Citrus x changshan-huyou]|uniref:Uncharacterized protein n=1 Tax=Citrus x changshan-huyou TaxID=2935761 RepID=A0AAP0QJG3_9ROSI